MGKEHLVSADEICKRFDIPRGSLYHLVKQGRIPAVDVTRPYAKKKRWRFDPDEVARALGVEPPTP